MDWDPVIGLYGFFLVAYSELLATVKEATGEVDRMRGAPEPKKLLEAWRYAIRWMSGEDHPTCGVTYYGVSGGPVPNVLPDLPAIDFAEHPELGDYAELWADVSRIEELMDWRNDRVHARVDSGHPSTGGTVYRLVDERGVPLAMDAAELRTRLEEAMACTLRIRYWVKEFCEKRRKRADIEREIGRILGRDE